MIFSKMIGLKRSLNISKIAPKKVQVQTNTSCSVFPLPQLVCQLSLIFFIDSAI